jgi:hypothetical protein
VAEPPTRILSCDSEQSLTDGFLKRFTCSGPHSSQGRFELGEGLFDGGEVGRIARSRTAPGSPWPRWLDAPALLYGLASCPSRRFVLLADWGEGAVRRRFQRQWRWPILPGSWRLPCPQARARRSASYSCRDCAGRCLWHALRIARSRIDGRERDIGATLIHKDQLLGWQLAYFCSPGGPVFLIALRGTHRFFLRVQPTRRMARLIVV